MFQTQRKIERMETKTHTPHLDSLSVSSFTLPSFFFSLLLSSLLFCQVVSLQATYIVRPHFTTKMLQCASPKTKDILVTNHSTIIIPKKINIDSMTLFSIQPTLQFTEKCPQQLHSPPCPVSIKVHVFNLPLCTSLLPPSTTVLYFFCFFSYNIKVFEEARLAVSEDHTTFWSLLILDGNFSAWTQ